MKSFSSVTVIVLTISGLGLLAMVLAPKCFDCGHQRSRQARAKSELHSLKSALQIYRLENRIYPSTEQGLHALIEKPDSEPLPPYWLKGGYLDRLPNDPWNREYYYQNLDRNGGVELYSLGRDGIPGGKGEDSDIIVEFEAEAFTEKQTIAWVERVNSRDDRKEIDAERKKVIAAQNNAQSEMQYLRDLIERYKEITNSYPSERDFQSLPEQLDNEHALKIYPTKKEWLEDPWGQKYLYRNPGTAGKAEVYTLGADGAKGGEHANQDLFSSTSDLTQSFPLAMFPADLDRTNSRIFPHLSGRWLHCQNFRITNQSDTHLQASCILMPHQDSQ